MDKAELIKWVKDNCEPNDKTREVVKHIEGWDKVIFELWHSSRFNHKESENLLELCDIVKKPEDEYEYGYTAGIIAAINIVHKYID